MSVSVASTSSREEGDEDHSADSFTRSGRSSETSTSNAVDVAGFLDMSLNSSVRIRPRRGLPACINRQQKENNATGAKRRLILASVFCLFFMSGEMVGGIVAGSLAIISDAAHLLTDFASFLISLSALYLARRPSTNKLSFGWHRVEVLGAFLSILLLWILTGVLCYSAVLRIQNNTYEINAEIMMITAATGVVFNIIMCTTLDEDLGLIRSDDEDRDGAGHRSDPLAQLETGANGNVPHQDCTESTPLLSNQAALNSNAAPSNQRDTERSKNLNVKAAFIHVLGDLLQSFGVLAASYIIYFKPDYKIADPICTFSFSALVMVSTMTIMKEIVVILMEGVPHEVKLPEIRAALLSVKGVVGVHNVRVWSLTMDKVAVSCHLHVAAGDKDPYAILEEASKLMETRYDVLESTIQLEKSSN